MTNFHHVELVVEIVEGHPEFSVVPTLKAQSTSRFLVETVPNRIEVGPGAVPFDLVAPRISKANQTAIAEFTRFRLRMMNGQNVIIADRIGVTNDETVGQNRFVSPLIGVDRTGDQRAVVQTRFDEIEQIRRSKVRDRMIRFEFETLFDAAGEIRQSVDRQTTGEIGVVAAQFRIGFFHQRDPEFVHFEMISRAPQTFLLAQIRQAIVDDDVEPLLKTPEAKMKDSRCGSSGRRKASNRSTHRTSAVRTIDRPE